MSGQTTVRRTERSEEEWRKLLQVQEFLVTRRGLVERPFTGRYFSHTEDGIYHCVCCALPLFDAHDKYEGRYGWPSFQRPVNNAHIRARTRKYLGEERIRLFCAGCDAYLGSMLFDGPSPSLFRFAVNSASLRFTRRHDELSLNDELLGDSETPATHRHHHTSDYQAVIQRLLGVTAQSQLAGCAA